ncbi:MAG: hypothetical protein ACTSUE_09595 [Promethearchaeota archaeon]
MSKVEGMSNGIGLNGEYTINRHDEGECRKGGERVLLSSQKELHFVIINEVVKFAVSGERKGSLPYLYQEMMNLKFYYQLFHRKQLQPSYDEAVETIEGIRKADWNQMLTQVREIREILPLLYSDHSFVDDKSMYQNQHKLYNLLIETIRDAVLVTDEEVAKPFDKYQGKSEGAESETTSLIAFLIAMDYIRYLFVAKLANLDVSQSIFKWFDKRSGMTRYQPESTILPFDLIMMAYDTLTNLSFDSNSPPLMMQSEIIRLEKKHSKMLSNVSKLLNIRIIIYQTTHSVFFSKEKNVHHRKLADINQIFSDFVFIKDFNTLITNSLDSRDFQFAMQAYDRWIGKEPSFENEAMSFRNGEFYIERVSRYDSKAVDRFAITKSLRNDELGAHALKMRIGVFLNILHWATSGIIMRRMSNGDWMFEKRIPQEFLANMRLVLKASLRTMHQGDLNDVQAIEGCVSGRNGESFECVFPSLQQSYFLPHRLPKIIFAPKRGTIIMNHPYLLRGGNERWSLRSPYYDYYKAVYGRGRRKRDTIVSWILTKKMSLFYEYNKRTRQPWVYKRT